MCTENPYQDMFMAPLYRPLFPTVSTNGPVNDSQSLDKLPETLAAPPPDATAVDGTSGGGGGNLPSQERKGAHNGDSTEADKSSNCTVPPCIEVTKCLPASGQTSGSHCSSQSIPTSPMCKKSPPSSLSPESPPVLSSKVASELTSHKRLRGPGALTLHRDRLHITRVNSSISVKSLESPPLSPQCNGSPFFNKVPKLSTPNKAPSSSSRREPLRSTGLKVVKVSSSKEGSIQASKPVQRTTSKQVASKQTCASESCRKKTSDQCSFKRAQSLPLSKASQSQKSIDLPRSSRKTSDGNGIQYTAENIAPTAQVTPVKSAVLPAANGGLESCTQSSHKSYSQFSAATELEILPNCNLDECGKKVRRKVLH